MSQIQTFNCFKCDAVNKRGQDTCVGCNDFLSIATLKSMGTGSVPNGYLWPLFPHEMTIGSNTSNDIVIPSVRVAKKHCKLIFQKGGIFISREDRENLVLVNGNNIQAGLIQKLNDGANLKIGLDEFKITYTNLSQQDMIVKSEPEKTQIKVDQRHSHNAVAARLMLVLGYIQELHASTDVKELLSNSVDAVLKLTGLDRGYAFIVEYNEDEMSLKEVVSRKLGGSDFNDKEYAISRSMLQKVMQSNGSVIIEDVDNNDATTISMRDLKIKSLVCLPLTRLNPETKALDLLGIIYADKMMATTPLPKQINSTLNTLSQLIVANIDRCQQFKQARLTTVQYTEYLKNLANEISTIGENLQLIVDNMEKSSNVANFQSFNQYIGGEQQKMTAIVRNLLSAIE